MRNTFKIIKYNLKTLFEFEFSFKIILSLILLPLAIFLCKLAMKLTNYSYLTLENIKWFLINPITVFIILILLIFLTMITLFEISTLIIIFDESYNNKKITLKDTIKISFSKCKDLFKIKNISVSFLVLFLIPFLNIGLSSNVVSSLKLPEFIMDYIESNSILFASYIIIYLILLSILSKWLFSLHYMVLEGNDFKLSREKSSKLIKGNSLIDKLKIIFIQFISTVFFVIFLLLGVFIIYLLHKIFTNYKVVKSILITIVWLFIVIALLLFMIISNAISYATLSALFYKHKKEKKEKVVSINYKSLIKDKKKNKVLRTTIIILIILSVFGGSILTYQILSGEANINIESVKNIEVTAHRGASIAAPENTMEAFYKAKEFGADWIELDVQQTKDKQIVVSHDFNLKRVANIKKDIIDLTYEKLKEIDVGSFFSSEYSDVRIPLLSDVIKYASINNIRLNIELKPTGKEEEFEKQVIDIINEYNFKDRCVVTSQVYNVLENIKEIDPTIKTVYVMSIAIGNIVEATSADAFSIESTNITDNLVSLVHNSGKEIYAWTINTEEKINKMINLNVDNIITDDVQLAKELVTRSKNSSLINEFLKILE